MPEIARMARLFWASSLMVSPAPQNFDAEIILLVRQGNSREFETLVERHLLPLEKFFHYLAAPPSLIDDLIQETFIKAFDNLGSFDLNRRFTPWLFAIGKNQFLDFQRKNYRPNLAHPAATITPDFTDQVVGDHEVTRILERLPAGDRFLLELRLFQGLSYAEISEIAGETQVGLRARFSRMMKKLREAFPGKEQE